MDQRDPIDYWLALVHAPGIGAAGVAEWLAQAGDPRRLFTDTTLRRTAPEPLRQWFAEPDWGVVEQARRWAEQPNHHLLSLTDSDFPQRLREIPSPPPLLYLIGDPRLLETPQLALVGSRHPTAIGAETAREFARYLAGVGLTITSGLATGIDGAAHQGALDGGGATVAVLGTGIDRVYPARHRDLAHAIVDGGGALVSEFPLGTPPLRGNFPRRNRIISGLSLDTLVVEAALQSGSLITARIALEQGREVFAVPGSIHNPLARGCHRLIRDGAKLVETAQDILEELAVPLRGYLEVSGATETTVEGAEFDLDEEYRRLLEAVDESATPVDLLISRSGLTAEEVSSMLLLLELHGWVTSSAGGYLRTPKRLK